MYIQAETSRDQSVRGRKFQGKKGWHLPERHFTECDSLGKETCQGRLGSMHILLFLLPVWGEFSVSEGRYSWSGTNVGSVTPEPGLNPLGLTNFAEVLKHL